MDPKILQKKHDLRMLKYRYIMSRDVLRHQLDLMEIADNGADDSIQNVPAESPPISDSATPPVSGDITDETPTPPPGPKRYPSHYADFTVKKCAKLILKTEKNPMTSKMIYDKWPQPNKFYTATPWATIHTELTRASVPKSKINNVDHFRLD